MSTGGRLTSIEAAAMSPQGTSYTPGKSARATGGVGLGSVAVKVSAGRSSFQLERDVGGGVDARPGAGSGRMIEVNMRAGLAPSTFAASSRTGGSSRRKPANSQMVSGSAN